MSDQQQRIAELQQQSAMQQLEIMRLREALETSLNCIDRTGWEFSCNMRLFGEKLDRYKDLLSTPTTYDDLMAWHEAQLGEPVAWIHIQGNYQEVSYRELDDQEIARGWEQRPLYAKKG